MTFRLRQPPRRRTRPYRDGRHPQGRGGGAQSAGSPPKTPFFQRLEKVFPMAGKPFAPRKVRAVRKKRRLNSGRDANIENHENRFADMERGRDAAVQPGAGDPPAGRLKSGKQAKMPMFSIISHPASRLESVLPKAPRCSFRSFRAASGGAASCCAMTEDGREEGLMQRCKGIWHKIAHSTRIGVEVFSWTGGGAPCVNGEDYRRKERT